MKACRQSIAVSIVYKCMTLCCTVSRGGCCNSCDCCSVLVAADLSSIVVRSFLFYLCE
ncbi:MULTISPECIES: hypothetical protein [Bacillus cereus group]|uniref:hypothetical protein n=1 Tax=Bacillus cereus group TaxID=86661 RepID=UPI001301A62E|nr:hypothetical protein [Bacillus thuringiensis]